MSRSMHVVCSLLSYDSADASKQTRYHDSIVPILASFHFFRRPIRPLAKKQHLSRPALLQLARAI